MGAAAESVQVDGDKLMQFVFRAVDEVGATLNADLVVIGDKLGWHGHVNDVHEGCERFFRPGYNAHLVAEWRPALEDVVVTGRFARFRRVAETPVNLVFEVRP